MGSRLPRVRELSALGVSEAAGQEIPATSSPQVSRHAYIQMYMYGYACMHACMHANLWVY